jgi:polar amino acid transport system substrate-binding protein
MHKLTYTFAAFLLTLTLTVSGYSECKIKAAWEPYEPYQFKDSKGNYTGLDLDIVKAVFEEAGCKIDFLEIPWKRQLACVEDGNINTIMGVSMLPERKKYANFSEPYRNESFAIFLEKGGNNKYKINKLEDLIKYNLTLGTVLGYYYGKKFDQAMKNPEFKKLIDEVKDEETNIKKLKAGRINAILIDPFVGVNELKKMKMLDKVDKAPLTLISEPIHAIFSKKSTTPDTVKTFNKGLKKLKESGKLNKIIAKYLR